MSVGIVRDGRIVYQNAIGLANIESGQHAATTTPYHVASVTKAFTASLAVILHDRGVVDLDAPVAKYLPDTVTISTQPQLGAKITLRQLASHTSGLPRGVPGRVQSVEGWYQLEPERLYKLLATVELEYEPGANDGYSNLGFGLLGHALERAAQQPFDELVQKLICEPLQLKNTRIQAHAPAATRHNPATGYSSSVPRRERTHSFRERLAPSGGLIASVDDLAAFLIAQMEAVNAQPNAGERPDSAFSKRALDQMHATVHLSDGSATHRALGWSIHQSSYIGRVLQKNGGRSNCSAWIGFSPEFRTGVVVVTNCGGPDVDPLGAWLLERLAPNAHHPVTKYGYAKVAPYSGMRWKGDRPIVQVDGKWLPLVSINEIPIDQIMTHAEKQFRSRARKRLAEDLVEVLSTMGQKVPWEATLGVEVDGEVKRIKKRMTENNRSMLRGP